MHVFARKPKSIPGAYYFGEFDEVPLAPFSISQAVFVREQYVGEPKHFHRKHQKVYVVLEGTGVLNVDGLDVVMSPDAMIQVEPGEVHFVKSVTSDRLHFLVILGAKENDKVVLN